jgi:G3E family GTPase
MIADGFAPAVHATEGRVASRCFVFSQPLNWQMFGIWLTMLLHRHGDRVLRMKGLLNIGTASGPLLLEGVQHVIHAPRHLPAWPDDDRRSRVVFIARDLDLDRVEDSLTTFQTLATVV